MRPTPDRPVLIVGAAGALGRVVAAAYRERGIPVRGLDIAPMTGIVDPEAAYLGSVTDPALTREAARGCRGIVHLGGVANPGSPWEAYLQTNIHGTWTLLEAARLEQVDRVLLASSNHAIGYARRDPGTLSPEAPPRPDSEYGVSKAAMEALGSFFADQHGIRVTSARIGSCQPEPTTTRALATWLSYPDLVRLVDAAMTGPWDRHRVVWGVSRNTRRWWDLSPGEAIGYRPRDDAEGWADRVAVAGRDDVVGGALPPFPIGDDAA